MVSGRGFAVSVPGGWEVKRAPSEVSAAAGEALVSVRTFPLEHAYRPALARAAANELDRRAAEVAEGLHGRLSTGCGHCSKKPSENAAVLTRGYEIRYGKLVLEITFVLVDRREYQLTCRRREHGDTSPCADLRSSFRLLA